MVMQAEGIGAAQYARSIRIIHAAGRRVAQFLEDYDVLLTPTMATPPLELGRLSLSRADLDGYRADISLTTGFTSLFNVSTLILTAHRLRCGDDMRTPPSAETKASNCAILYLSRESNAHPLVLKISNGTIGYITAVRRLVEIFANRGIVRISTQATRSGARLRNFSTASRYREIAASIWFCVVSRPKLNRMALCASASLRPSARNT